MQRHLVHHAPILGVDLQYRDLLRVVDEQQFILGPAVAELELGEWLASHRKADEAARLLARARETFERLHAAPWLERAARAAGGEAKREAVAAPG